MKINLNELRKIVKQLLKEEIDSTTFLTYDKLPPEVKTYIDRNITVGVTFIKKDGSIRHMAFRRFLKAYEHSTAEKTDAQANRSINNNMMNIYDTNEYIRLLKETGDEKKAAKGSYRFFKFDTVFAFLCGGKLYDMREVNHIKERFGDEVYNELSPKMKFVLQKDIEITDNNL